LRTFGVLGNYAFTGILETSRKHIEGSEAFRFFEALHLEWVEVGEQQTLCITDPPNDPWSGLWTMESANSAVGKIEWFRIRYPEKCTSISHSEFA
jgi:hypothetical protein